MFVKFRQSQYRLHVSLVSGSRIDGKVWQEHVGSLGSIETPLTVAGRVVFWRSAHQRIAKLSNRIGDGQGKIFGELHAKIPMPTPDEQTGLQVENAAADETFWAQLHDMHDGTIADHKGLAASVAKKIADGEAEKAKAAAARDAARNRRERAERGENVGFGKPITEKDIEGIVGRKTLKRARVIAELSERGYFEELLAERRKLIGQNDNTALRRVLKRHGLKINR